MLDTIVKPLKLHVEAYSHVKENSPKAKGISAAVRSDQHRAAGLSACLKAWIRVRGVPAHNWKNLARCDDDELVIAALSMARENSGTGVALSAIASEVEHALEHGLRSTTPLAFVLMASIALECFDGGNDAIALSEAALDIALKEGHSNSNCIRVIHANLIVSRTAGLDHAMRLLSDVWECGFLPLHEQLNSISTAFISGMPLPDISNHLNTVCLGQRDQQACDDSSNEMSLRSDLISALRGLEGMASLEKFGRQRTIHKNQRSGYWLTKLQSFWFAGNFQSARVASERAAILLTPFSPLADIVNYHLLSALTFGRLKLANSGAVVAIHSLELNRLSRVGAPSMLPIAELAAAVLDRCNGKTLVALSGLEHAYIHADRLGQHWVAALAAEEAALAASNAGLHSVVDHYRRLAMMSNKRWGALGRVRKLEREWGCASDPLAEEDGVENARLLFARKAEEMQMSIAHEVNQPLAAIALHSGAAMKWLSRAVPNVERALESLVLISDAGRHAGDIVRVMKQFALNEVHEYECVDVDQAIHDISRLLQTTLRKHGIKTELNLNLHGATVLANRVQLQQVITNLIVNAVEALSDVTRLQGARHIKVQTRNLSDNEVEISVEDNGPGIDLKDHDRIFSRLFTTKVGNSGLGLSISLAIIRAHHGSIEFEPCKPHGARFRVRLPIQAS